MEVVKGTRDQEKAFTSKKDDGLHLDSWYGTLACLVFSDGGRGRPCHLRSPRSNLVKIDGNSQIGVEHGFTSMYSTVQYSTNIHP